MQPPETATRSYRDACETYVIDSDPQKEAVDTKAVLDTAFRLDAEVASLADVYQDKDATVDKLLHGLEVYDDHPFGGELILPLQDPFIEAWQDVGEPTKHWVGIGGLKEASTAKRVDAARNLRQAVGSDVQLHGFGWGVKGHLAQVIRAEPELLNSVDYSTPAQNNITGIEPGKERTSVQAMYAGAKLIEDLRSVTPYVDGLPGEYREPEQMGLNSVKK